MKRSIFVIALAMWTAHSWAVACVQPFQVELDTIADCTVEVRVSDMDNTLFSVDTATCDSLLADLVAHYENYSHCYIGSIDTIIGGTGIIAVPYSQSDVYPIDPIEPALPNYYIDSIHVVVDTVLKGSLSKTSFWVLDSISLIMPAKRTALGKTSSIGYSSYASLKGESFIFFGDNPLDLRTSSVRPPSLCTSSNNGHFLSTQNRIHKGGVGGYGVPALPGVEIDLADFLSAISSTNLTHHVRGRVIAGYDTKGLTYDLRGRVLGIVNRQDHGNRPSGVVVKSRTKGTAILELQQ